jgi:hypothetical protein
MHGCIIYNIKGQVSKYIYLKHSYKLEHMKNTKIKILDKHMNATC